MGRKRKIKRKDKEELVRKCERPPLWRRLVLVLALVFGLEAGVRAHDPGISTAQGELRADALVLDNGFAPADVRILLGMEARSGGWTEAEFAAAQADLRKLAHELWRLEAGGKAIVPREIRPELTDADTISFHYVYPRPAATFTLTALKLGGLQPNHRSFVMIVDESGAGIGKKLFNANENTLTIELAPVGAGPDPGAQPVAEAPMPAFEFVKLGIEHIWMGYDHLLFLFALLVVCRSFRSIVGIVTCFTIAHSVTLALATLEIVRLPGRLVEAAIAASIVYVGVENLLRRGAEPRGRWALTFAFGLVHGFGFATVLRDLGVGGGRGQGILMPLFTFNLGVEIGQVAIAAVVLPIVWQLRKKEAFIRWGVPGLSAAVTLAGLYWLLERTVLA